MNKDDDTDKTVDQPESDWQHGNGIWKVVQHIDGHISVVFGPVADLHPIVGEKIIWQGKTAHPSQALEKAKEVAPHLFE